MEPRTLFSADLAGSFVPFVEPVQVSGSQVEIDLDLTNLGTSTTTGALYVDFYASRDASFDPAVDTFVSRERVRGQLAPGQTERAIFNLTVPLSLPEGSWRAIAVLNPDGRVAETSAANNTLVSQVGTIVVPDYDLAGELDRVNFPPSLVVGQATRGSARVLINNVGTIAAPRSAAVDVRLYARPDSAGTSNRVLPQDILLGEARNQRLGNLQPDGRAKAVNLRLATNANLPAATYRLVLAVDTAEQLAESDESNNVTVLTDQTFTAAAPYHELHAAIADNARLPAEVISGDGTRIRLPLTVTNLGNVPLERRQTIDVAVYADKVGGGSTLVTTVEDLSVSSLRNGRSKRLNLNVLLPPGLADGEYRLRAVADANGDVTQSTTAHNAAHTSQTISVTEGYHELRAAIADNVRLPAAVVSGDSTRIRLPLTITNNGNISLERRQTIDVAVYADKVGGGSTLLTTVEDVSVSNLRAGKSKRLNLNVLLPPGLTDGDYRLRVVADASGDVTQPSTADNTASTDQTITVAQGFFAPAFRPVNIRYLGRDEFNLGPARLSVTFEITNRGNIAYPRGARLDALVSLRRDRDPADGSEDILAGTTLGVPVSNLRPGQSRRIRVDLVVDDSISTGTYRFAVAANLANGNAITNATDLGIPQIIGDDTLRVSTPSGVFSCLCFSAPGVEPSRGPRYVNFFFEPGS